MTETLTQNGATFNQRLRPTFINLGSIGCKPEASGYGGLTAICPSCRKAMHVLTDESTTGCGAVFECESGCSDDTIVRAMVSSPKVPTPVEPVPEVDSPPSPSLRSWKSETHGSLVSHGTHESHGGHGPHGTLGLPGNAISRAITETLPTEPKATGKRVPKSLAVNSVAWPFARHLKSITELRSLELAKLLEVLETASANWHETASELFQNPELLPEKDRFIEEVIVCFGDAKTGIDESRLYVATTRARSAPYLDSNLTPPQQVIAALCQNLGELNGDGEFYLSEQGAADAANAAKRSGTAALRKLVMLHLIDVIRKGTNDKGVKGKRPKRQATQYRWIGPL